MARITVEPIDLTLHTRREETLSQALYRSGVHLEQPCNGKGSCGGCRIWVLDPESAPHTPHESISAAEAEQGCRLSCQLVPRGDMTVRLPMDFLHDSQRFRQSQSILVGELAPSSRVVSAVKLYGGRELPEMAYDNLAGTTLLQSWDPEFEPKGLAVDLGTTTIVVTLISLSTGKELATASRLNPQMRFGHDVMTRIQHGSTAQGLRELADAAREGVNELIQEVCWDSGSHIGEILDLVLGGNTTMLQLISQTDPAPLGRIPFSVDMETGTSYPLQKMGLMANPAARVYVPPVMHAFLGSDISAGLLVHSDFFHPEKTVLFADVGTNGEIALNARGRRLACSTAAGPAFEGMGISCGMRASIGAVEAVNTNEHDLELRTVGDAPVRGICGSGIVDLLACLLRLELMDGTGRLQNPPPEYPPEGTRSRLREEDGQPAVLLGDGKAFTQRDVRQVQLAKGAVRAGMDMLLQEADCSVDELDALYIAGGFGAFLDPGNLETLGIIPPGSRDKVVFTGNSCRSGCVWLLTDISYRRFLEQSVQGIEHLSIAESTKFMDLYADSMEFQPPGSGLKDIGSAETKAAQK